ncbi:MAG: helix-turn-helix transcriptional regulator [Cyclobacteriaceae bacterium]
MLSRKQITAARVFLGWSQEDLAYQTDLTRASIQNVEKGTVETRPKNIAKIRDVFENAGIEFIDGGVRLLEREKVRVLEGAQTISILFDDIINTMRDLPEQERELLIFGVDEQKFTKNFDAHKLDDHLKLRQHYKINQKLLLLKGDTNIIGDPDCYRWVPAEYFTTTPTLVYGHKVATIIWSEPPEIIIVSNELYARERAKNFKLMWEKATETPSFHKGV